MRSKRNIVVAGYPKSGTTWLTRLTAEIAQCPVEGFWNKPEHDEIAIEGNSRKSKFRCYKSHHQIQELEYTTGKDIEKIIYVIRDPRDIVVSGGHYFYPDRFKLIEENIKQVRLLNKLYNKLFRNEDYRKKRMMKAVLHGDRDLHYWCRIPWKEHVEPFNESDYLCVKFESMLSSPYQVVKRVLNYLGIERSKKEITRSIKKQSKEKKRKELKKKGRIDEAKNFIRSGEKRQWENELTRKEVKNINMKIGSFLEKIGYER